MTSQTMADSVEERILALARGIAAQHAIRQDFSAGDALAEVGLSSLDLVNLMVAVEVEFDLMIPADRITPKNFYSVGTIARMIEAVRPVEAA